MNISDQLLLICSAIGGLNGLLLAAFYFCRRREQRMNRLFALLLLALSVRVLKSVLFYFNPGLSKQILQLGLSACWMIGPLLFCYCQSICLPMMRRYQLWLQLLLPLAVVLLAGVIWPYQHYPTLWGGAFYQFINYSWLAYIIVSSWMLWHTTAKLPIRAMLSSARHAMLILMLAGNLLLWSAYYFSSYTSYISGAFAFSLLLALSGASAWFYRQPAMAKTSPYANKKMSDAEAAPLLLQLDDWMQIQQPFLDAELTLPKLTRQLGWPSGRLSQLLNDNLAQSFPDYINGWRINHAKMLLDNQLPLKMQILAEQSGFNSLSTFYSAFKKFAGVTPAAYRQSVLPK